MTRFLGSILRSFAMTQQYTEENNVTISMPDGGSVPIVTQTEIEPMKMALSLMFALVTTTALTEPPPVPKKKKRRPWEFARPSKTHGESDQESSRFGQRSGGTADRSNPQGRHWPLRRAQSSRARPLVAIQSQDSDDQSA